MGHQTQAKRMWNYLAREVFKFFKRLWHLDIRFQKVPLGNLDSTLSGSKPGSFSFKMAFVPKSSPIKKSFRISRNFRVFWELRLDLFGVKTLDFLEPKLWWQKDSLEFFGFRSWSQHPTVSKAWQNGNEGRRKQEKKTRRGNKGNRSWLSGQNIQQQGRQTVESTEYPKTVSPRGKDNVSCKCVCVCVHVQDLYMLILRI